MGLINEVYGGFIKLGEASSVSRDRFSSETPIISSINLLRTDNVIGVPRNTAIVYFRSSDGLHGAKYIRDENNSYVVIPEEDFSDMEFIMIVRKRVTDTKGVFFEDSVIYLVEEKDYVEGRSGEVAFSPQLKNLLINVNENMVPGKLNYTSEWIELYYRKTTRLQVNVNGDAKKVSNVHANINGQSRKIIKTFYNINGELKEG